VTRTGIQARRHECQRPSRPTSIPCTQPHPAMSLVGQGRVQAPRAARGGCAHRRWRQRQDAHPLGPNALLFTGQKGGPLRPHVLQAAWERARRSVGATYRLHDLRHLGATLAAGTGATTKEIMRRLGHQSAQAALIFGTPTRTAMRPSRRPLPSSRSRLRSCRCGSAVPFEALRVGVGSGEGFEYLP